MQGKVCEEARVGNNDAGTLKNPKIEIRNSKMSDVWFRAPETIPVIFAAPKLPKISKSYSRKLTLNSAFIRSFKRACAAFTSSAMSVFSDERYVNE